ncbi:sugar phosphate isomerase/epimerase family protein [Paenibacillus alkalitolerans]|uniref:sugar phosphate isomerase/epimerase family protein n=1 Tax=Paenibacillus alkalitolerans TaxID=2799335 RepID=UPI0018F3B0B6|nr:sugar phosphate isomerase/epimerase [Paenibacillus alkalitolerans]
MKLSVFTVATPDLTPVELIGAAKEAGLEGIEWRYTTVPDNVKGEAPTFWRNNLCTIDPGTGIEQLQQLNVEVERAGMTTAALTPYLKAGDVEGTERAMKHAKALGAKSIRIGVPRYDRSENYNELFEIGIRYFHEVQELSKQYGIKGLVETHHVTIAPSASLAYNLVSRFDPEHIGVLYDPGNMVHEGYENYRMGMELLGDYLAHVHVKNAGWFRSENGEWQCRWMPFTEGAVNWKQVLADLKSVGYAGWYGVEDFSGFYDSRAMLREYASWFRGLAEED